MRRALGAVSAPLDVDRLDDDILERAVARAGRGARDRVDDLLGVLVGDLAEDACAVVEPLGGPVVMKNCEPLVPGPALAIASR